MANEDKYAKTIDDEELDEVAGGTKVEIMKDLRFMRDLKVLSASDMDDVLDAIKKGNYEAVSDIVDSKLWKKAGVNFFYNSSEGKNFYATKEKKPLSRNDALIYGMRAAGKYLDLEKYI